MVNHIAQSIEAFLNSKIHFVVHGSQMVGYFSGSSKVGRVYQADGKAVKPRPPSLLAVVGFNSFFGITGCNGRNDRRIQSAGKQNAVRHIGHQLAMHGSFEGLAQCFNTAFVVLNGLNRFPIALIPRLRCAVAAIEIMSGRKFFNRRTNPFQSFKF